MPMKKVKCIWKKIFMDGVKSNGLFGDTWISQSCEWKKIWRGGEVGGGMLGEKYASKDIIFSNKKMQMKKKNTYFVLSCWYRI